MAGVEDELAALTTMSSAQLRTHWAALTASPVPRILAGKTLSGVDAAALTATDAIPEHWAQQERTMLCRR